MPESYEHLISNHPYQVLLLSSPLPVPFHFAVHTWLLSVDHGEIKRWEVWQSKNNCKTSWGHVHLNLFSPWVGVKKSFLARNSRHPYTVHSVTKGAANSPAAEIIHFLENKIMHYPFLERYRYLPGPNSNSFIQWVVNHFPDAGLELPPNAWGKRYKVQML